MSLVTAPPPRSPLAATRGGFRILLAARLPRTLLTAALGAAVSFPASAQCAMCGLSNNGSASRSAFLHGAIVLLVPVSVILGAIALVTWKLRDFGSRGPS